MKEKIKEVVSEVTSCCAPTCCGGTDEKTAVKKVADNPESLKEAVREKYAQIAKGEISCCGVDTGNGEISNVSLDASNLDGYNADADLNLGCGLPTELAKIKQGYTVVDLGSGAGNDAFIARQEVGDSGKVIGIDFTTEMNEKARKNAGKLGYENVEFLQGDIESIPLEKNVADVVVSNCVMNLVPDKHKAYSETFRILKPGGHFSISDIVTEGEMPDELRLQAELYAGCVSGATDINAYVKTIKEVGFENVEIQKKRVLNIPQEILALHIPADVLAKAQETVSAIYSITIFGQKPA